MGVYMGNNFASAMDALAMSCKFVILVIIGASLSSSSRAEMYKCTGEDGRIKYQDQPCQANKEKQEKMTDIASGPIGKFDGDPIRASGKIAGMTYAIETLIVFCGKYAPSTLIKAQQAFSDWRARNESLIEKSGQIVRAKISSEDRVIVAGMLKNQMMRMVEVVKRESPEYHRQWCGEMPVKLASPQYDLSKHPVLVKTIMNYRLH